MARQIFQNTQITQKRRKANFSTRVGGCNPSQGLALELELVTANIRKYPRYVGDQINSFKIHLVSESIRNLR